MLKRIAYLLVPLFFLPLAPDAHAASDEVDGEPDERASGIDRADPPEELRRVSVTISPGHLLLGALPYVGVTYWFEFTGEFRIGSKGGAALVAGWERVEVVADNVNAVHVPEIGAKGQWFPIGDFEEGVQLGAEAIYRAPLAHRNNLAVRRQTDVPILTAGPYAGYKHVNDAGFTVEFQVGARYPVVRDPKAEDEVGYRPTRVRLLVNLGLGWTF